MPKMLPSPYIEGTLPAFYEEKDSAIITIPFSMSRAVNKNEVDSFRLKIKNLQSSIYLLILKDPEQIDYGNQTVSFRISKDNLSKFTIGAFYKVQLAYVSEGTTGHYSTVGIVKYTTKPSVYIDNLNKNLNNGHNYEYTGVYSQEGKDITEKAYSYRFVIKDSFSNIVKDTGFIVHNSNNDNTFYESKDTFLYNSDLKEKEKYSIQYIVKTNNGLEISSPEYKIMAKNLTIQALDGVELVGKLNFDNAYIQINMKNFQNEKESLITGKFILSRSSEDSDYSIWEKIDEFNLFLEKPSEKFWRDFTIEQGKKYKYSIQQFNDNIYSERIITDAIYADFEDSFLYDGERQLKIRFNPKVISFKNTILEAKTDTLGGKYAFISRNGNTQYKEFPVSGLISYHSDEELLFLDNKVKHDTDERKFKTEYKIKNFIIEIENDSNIYYDNYEKYYIYLSGSYIKWVDYLKDNYPNLKYIYSYAVVKNILRNLKITEFYEKVRCQVPLTEDVKFLNVNLTNDNFYLEREFKLEVLEWLTNGKPKLYKSPAEGNYIVRLMNSSLSPTEQLGRMLHTFSSTAYEIDDLTYDNLLKYNILNIGEANKKGYYIETIPLATKDANYVKLNANRLEYSGPDENGYYFATGQINYADKFENIVLEDITPGTMFSINNELVIVDNGNLELPFQVNSIYIPMKNGQKQKTFGQLQVSYYDDIKTVFNQIVSIDIEEVIGQQKIGKFENIKENIENVAKKIISFSQLNFYKREEVESSEEDLNSKLEVLKTKKNTIPLFGQTDDLSLYWKIDFADIDANNNVLIPKNRESANEYLFDIKRDYPLLINNGSLYKKDNNNVYSQVLNGDIFDVNAEYYMQKEITVLSSKENIKKMLYKQEYEQLYSQLNTDSQRANFESQYDIYDWKISINGEEYDLEIINSYSFKDLSSINSISTSNGIYCDLFYQALITNYDISTSSELIELKRILDDYDEKINVSYYKELVEDEEDLEKIIEIQNEYLNLLEDIYSNYGAVYETYISKLEEYLKSIQREV